MGITTSALGGQVEAIIRRRSQLLMDEHIARYKRQVAGIAEWWRREMRIKLSVTNPRGMHAANLSDTPYMRTGDLADSLDSVSVRVRKGSRINERVLRLIPNWDPNPHGSAAGDYGSMLNRNHSAPYGGWKDRAHDALRKRIANRVQI